MNLDSMRHAVHSLYKASAEAVMPVRGKSGFKEQGVLTPEEFVTAGDYLVRTCPTWSWNAGDANKAWSFLPHSKQFLLTRNVPSNVRAAAVEEYGEQADSMADGEGDPWVLPASSHPDLGGAEVDLLSAAAGRQQPGSSSAAADQAAGRVTHAAAEDDIPDIDDIQAEEDDEAAAPLPSAAAAEDDHVLHTRTYDLMISYDKYYQVPRFWLRGYDEHRHPLQAKQILQDVTEEHARKTITVDPFPHTAQEAASIHPCKHSETMHRLMEMAGQAGHELDVQGYMVLFLKFISSVIPTIEYDYTMSAGVGSRAR